MAVVAAVVFTLLLGSTCQDLIDDTPGFSKIQEPSADMTIVKTHYDCRGYPMWRQVSRIKSRAGKEVDLVTTSKETFNKHFDNRGDAGVASVFYKSMRSRLRPTPPVTTTPTTPSVEVAEVGPDRIIDTPVISCPEGYNDDFQGRCRRVFPDNY